MNQSLTDASMLPHILFEDYLLMTQRPYGVPRLAGKLGQFELMIFPLSICTPSS